MLCPYASFIISSSLFKSCIIPVAWVCHPLHSMSITGTSTLLRGNPPQKRTSVRFGLVRHFRHFTWHSDFCFPRSANEPVLLSCHLYAACHNAIDRLLKRPSRISLAVTATSYMEGSKPFIYRCAPRGTPTGTSDPCTACFQHFTFPITWITNTENKNPTDDIKPTGREY